MDEVTVLLFVGFILTGGIIGYPIGYVLGRLDNNPRPRRRQRKQTDILSANILEEK